MIKENKVYVFNSKHNGGIQRSRTNPQVFFIHLVSYRWHLPTINEAEDAIAITNLSSLLRDKIDIRKVIDKEELINEALKPRLKPDREVFLNHKDPFVLCKFMSQYHEREKGYITLPGRLQRFEFKESELPENMSHMNSEMFIISKLPRTFGVDPEPVLKDNERVIQYDVWDSSGEKEDKLEFSLSMTRDLIVNYKL